MKQKNLWFEIGDLIGDFTKKLVTRMDGAPKLHQLRHLKGCEDIVGSVVLDHSNFLKNIMMHMLILEVRVEVSDGIHIHEN